MFSLNHPVRLMVSTHRDGYYIRVRAAKPRTPIRKVQSSAFRLLFLASKLKLELALLEKPLAKLLLCAPSVFSVSLWFVISKQ